MAVSKALAAWTELNDRQQGTLAIIFGLDQAAEEAHRAAGASGEFDKRPASVWRAIDFAQEPSGLGLTRMQERLDFRGWHSQGNGATVAALVDRGLITRGQRVTAFGWMITVTLTRAGRAAARAGTSTMPTRTPKPALSERSWEALALLWMANQRGGLLRWGRSATIDRRLIEAHVPPLAERSTGALGYRITERGREFFREHYAVHVATYPDVRAPHPDGEAAEPWPAAADAILLRHRAYYRALCAQWQAARDAQQAAEAEATVTAPDLPEVLPASVRAQSAERHELWCETARRRAELAGAHVTDLARRAEVAARAYAVATLAAFRAATAGTNPLAVLEPPGETDSWDGRPLAPPPETGIHAIDAAAKKLHTAAVGTPLRRRGPAPKRRARHASADAGPPPGDALDTLAEFLRGYVEGGALTRRMYPAGG
ncbi:hypothetical protein [Frankia sp. CcI49]|uniref:hypothetical protein n=1 Tax=Frankia sp. CcI49 TaxID=1745382 RepID=UPI0010567A83|nr:hypothetical protein [Frankia sp. CcI49]